jgi:hypothetical protein
LSTFKNKYDRGETMKGIFVFAAEIFVPVLMIIGIILMALYVGTYPICDFTSLTKPSEPNRLTIGMYCESKVGIPLESGPFEVSFGDDGPGTKVFFSNGQSGTKHEYPYNVGGIATYNMRINFVHGLDWFGQDYQVVIDDTE